MSAARCSQIRMLLVGKIYIAYYHLRFDVSTSRERERRHSWWIDHRVMSGEVSTKYPAIILGYSPHNRQHLG